MTVRERRRQGMIESAKAIALLHEKWPLAFPKKYDDVKPLARSVRVAIIASTGWDKDYTHGVLAAWKQRLSYCNAILRDTIRIDIDGNLTDEIVDDRSRALAVQSRKKALEAMRRRAAKRKEREAKNRDAAEAMA